MRPVRTIGNLAASFAAAGAGEDGAGCGEELARVMQDSIRQQCAKPKRERCAADDQFEELFRYRGTRKMVYCR
ncbi:MAG: hypothetical protein R2727_06700 [Bacteroidales bacterium]